MMLKVEYKMEKVIVTSGSYVLNQSDVLEVEKLLSDGWSVKSVTMEHGDGHVTAIFVLQKNV